MCHFYHSRLGRVLLVSIAISVVSLNSVGKLVNIHGKDPAAEPTQPSEPPPMPNVGEVVYIGTHYRVANYLTDKNTPGECQLLGADIAYDETLEKFARVIVVKNGGVTRDFTNIGPALCKENIKVLLPLGVLQLEYRDQLRRTENAQKQEAAKKSTLDLLHQK